MVRAAVTMPTHASTGHPLRGDDRTRGGGVVMFPYLTAVLPKKESQASKHLL